MNRNSIPNSSAERTPGLGWARALTVFGVVLLLAGSGFELWRAWDKRTRGKSLSSRMHNAPITQLPKVYADLGHWHYSPVKIQGHFDSHHFLLDNQFHNHQVGYRVISPFETDNHAWVLIDRGWVPMGRTRKDLPKLPPEATNIMLDGVIMPLDPPVVLKNKYWQGSGWPRVIETMKPYEMGEQLNHRFPPFTIQLYPSSAGTFTATMPGVKLSPVRHYGYAIQFFIMAFILILVYRFSTRQPQ